MNYNNLAEQTNYLAGSSEFEDFILYITKCNLPGLSVSPPAIGGRFGTQHHPGADAVSYNELTLEVLVDEDLTVYLEILKYFKKRVRMDMTFDNESFPFWIQINNNKGNKLFMVYFTNCRITSISDFQFDSQSDIQQQTFTLNIVYDYYDVVVEKDVLNKVKNASDDESISLEVAKPPRIINS